MKLLLDTHAALWFVEADERLSPAAREQMEAVVNEKLVSAVVVLEVAIKRSVGKLDVPAGLVQRLLDWGGSPLPVSLEHAAGVERLPLHHRNPFDRLLVAQAQVEGAVLVSGDPAMAAYGVPILW